MGGFRVQPIPYNPPDPLETISRLSALRNAGQQYQMQQVQLEQAKRNAQDQKILGDLMVKHQGNLDKVADDAPKSGVSANGVLGLQQHILERNQKSATLTTEQLKNIATQNDNARGLIQPVIDAPAEKQPALYAQARQQALQNPQAYGITDPNQIPEQFPGVDPLKTQIALHMGGKAQADQIIKEREVAAQEMTARARMAAAGNAGIKNEPLPPGQAIFFNKQLAARYQVLNPGKPLPPEFSLQPGATRQDYQDLDKALEQVEKAKGVKAQQDTANEMRREMLDLAKQRETRQENTATRADVRAHDKNYVQPAEAVEKSYQMMDSAYNEYKAAKAQGKTLPTGAESMLALSTHLSTTFGNVKGARITKDMIEHHLGARGIGDSAVVAVQKLTNGDVLSPDQWEAFHKLIKESRDLSWKTAVKEADRKKIPVDFLPDDLKGMSQGADKSPSTSQPLKIKLPSGREVTIE